MDQGTIIFAAAGLGAVAVTGLVAWGLSRRVPKHTSLSTIYKPRLLKACGPVTARQAVHLAREALLHHTPAGPLRGLSSGPELDPQGRSTRWNVIFETDKGRKTGVVSFSSSTNLKGSALVVRIEVLPTPPQPGRPLAELFEDSSDALVRLIREGADFGIATAKATLSVRPDAQGRPIWRLDVRGQTYETPFTEAA
ncbi:MAG: hypothetical protein ACI89L_000949 [Phycisphaerales bacterium]